MYKGYTNLAGKGVNPTLTNIYFSVELKQVYSYQHKHCLSLNRVSSLKLLV